MSEKTNNPGYDYEQAIFDQYLTQNNYVGPSLVLPEPSPSSQWLEREAGGDTELAVLLAKKEALENNRVAMREAGRDDEEYMHGFYQERQKVHDEIAAKREAP